MTRPFVKVEVHCLYLMPFLGTSMVVKFFIDLLLAKKLKKYKYYARAHITNKILIAVDKTSRLHLLYPRNEPKKI